MSKSRAYHLKRWFGITEAQYSKLLKEQNGVCFVCQTLPRGRRLAVDHDHKTGEIRGLLCYYCNKYIVGRNKNPVWLLRAAEHIQRHTGWFVPENRPKRRRRRKKKK